LDVDTYKKVAKFAPEALKLVNPETKEVEFGMSYTKENCGNISDYGVSFDTKTRGQKLAVALGRTGLVDMSVEDVKTKLAEENYKVLINLGKVETQVTAALADVDATVAIVEDSITVEAGEEN